MNVSRPQFLAVAAHSGLVVLLIVSTVHLLHQRNAAVAAAFNYEKCKQLAARIEDLQAVPAHSSLHRRSSQDLALKVEQAARIAEIGQNTIVRINPQASHRVGKSSYLQQPTSIEIRQVSTEQLAKFLQELSSADSGLQPTSLRLTAPRILSDQQRETWTVEVVLTHVFFSPE